METSRSIFSNMGNIFWKSKTCSHEKSFVPILNTIVIQVVSTYSNDEETSTITYSTTSIIYQILAGETESMSQERMMQ